MTDDPHAQSASDEAAVLPDAKTRLARLAEQVRREIELTSYAHRDWIPARGDELDVLVIGGGQAGLATLFGLRRRDITRVLGVDSAPSDRFGPWSTTARMHTLRTPKRLRWADQGIPALTPHAWYEARHGAEPWDALTFIPRLDWNEYLQWFRTTLDLPVEYETTVTAVHRPDTPDGPFPVELEHAGERRTVRARRVVFATGLEGAGGRNVPQSLFGHLPRALWDHTSDDIDFAALAGKRVGVLGGGASAFDNAGCALEAGVAEVRQYMRRPRMPVSNPLRWMEFSGFLDHYADWDDDRKWRFTKRVLDVDQPATQASLWRCYAHDDYSLEFASPWLATRVEDGKVVVDVAGREERFDHVIAGTGVGVDLRRRPELGEFVDDIARWGDVYTPPAELAAPSLAAYPYLGGDFSFRARAGHDAPWLSRLYHFAQGARVSMGITGHQLSGLPAGVERLVWGIGRDVFVENGDAIMDDFFAYDTPELTNIGPQPAGTPPRQTSPITLDEGVSRAGGSR